jgi:hypothetical protein
MFLCPTVSLNIFVSPNICPNVSLFDSFSFNIFVSEYFSVRLFLWIFFLSEYLSRCFSVRLFLWIFMCPNICLSQCFSVRLFLWIFVCPVVCPISIGALPTLPVALRVPRFKMQKFCCLHTGYEDTGKFWLHQWIKTARLKETESCLASGNVVLTSQFGAGSFVLPFAVWEYKGLHVGEETQTLEFRKRGGGRWHETGEKCTLMSFMIYSSLRILVGWPNRE